MIALGLYRLPGAQDNKHPYIYTNPPPSTKLTHKDKVFVLAFHLPPSLLYGLSDDLVGEEKKDLKDQFMKVHQTIPALIMI